MKLGAAFLSGTRPEGGGRQRQLGLGRTTFSREGARRAGTLTLSSGPKMIHVRTQAAGLKGREGGNKNKVPEPITSGGLATPVRPETPLSGRHWQAARPAAAGLLGVYKAGAIHSSSEAGITRSHLPATHTRIERDAKRHIHHHSTRATPSSTKGATLKRSDSFRVPARDDLRPAIHQCPAKPRQSNARSAQQRDRPQIWKSGRKECGRVARRGAHAAVPRERAA